MSTAFVMNTDEMLKKATAVVAVARYAKDGVDTHHGLHVLLEGSLHLRTVGLFKVERANDLYRAYFSAAPWRKRYLSLMPEVSVDYCQSHCIPIGWDRDTAMNNTWVHTKDDMAFDQNAYDWVQAQASRLARMGL